MKHLRSAPMVFCAIAFLTLDTVYAGPASITSSSNKMQIVDLEHQWLQAASAGDRETLKSLLADNFVDVNVDGQIRDRAQVIGRPGAPPHSNQTLEELRVRVWGDTAVATGINVVHSLDKGWTVEVPFTDTFTRVQGRWRAVSSQETLRRKQGQQQREQARNR